MSMKTNVEELIGKCGFYCGSCPDYINGSCSGCRTAHKTGDCFTFDCVDKKKLDYCGRCSDFPCKGIMTREKATVLDKKWLEWKHKDKVKRA
ncbi:DUF3795 domain-containing protein [Acidaminobacter sp. JC074]|nr:DUF3795 domain-containing protein [Acidaminobacter sp. JC074]